MNDQDYLHFNNSLISFLSTRPNKSNENTHFFLLVLKSLHVEQFFSSKHPNKYTNETQLMLPYQMY